MDIELFESLSKFPFVHNNIFYSTKELAQNSFCTKRCKSKDCLRKDNYFNKKEYRCSHDYDCFLIIIGDDHFLINGLIVFDNHTISKEKKDAKKDFLFERKSIEIFEQKIFEIERHLQLRANETTLKNFAIFHDFKTSMNIFYTCTQNIIYEQPGFTFENKLLGSNQNYKDLYNSLALITSQLQMIDVILNPQSITFGNKKEINIFQLFHKMTMLFTHLSIKKNNVRLNQFTLGSIVRNSNCYESIEFIPLILIDNALKYSVSNSIVEVEITQLYGRARVSVRNIGPLVEDENVDKIFEKFFRANNGVKFTKDGIGMGLWIAQQILETHDSKLKYIRSSKNGEDVGLNIFEFEIKTV